MDNTDKKKLQTFCVLIRLVIQLFHSQRHGEGSRGNLTTKEEEIYQVVASVGFLSQGNYDMSSVSNNVTLCIKAFAAALCA